MIYHNPQIDRNCFQYIILVLLVGVYLSTYLEVYIISNIITICMVYVHFLQTPTKHTVFLSLFPEEAWRSSSLPTMEGLLCH